MQFFDFTLFTFGRFGRLACFLDHLGDVLLARQQLRLTNPYDLLVAALISDQLVQGFESEQGGPIILVLE